AAELVSARARGIGLGRLRLTVAPNGAEGLTTEVVTAEVDPRLVFPPWERGAELRSLIVEEGLGAHKWADRTVLENAEAQAPPGSVALVLDSDGVVMEASRASVFAVREGRLFTPPADGRILPGIARGRAIEVAGEEGVEAHEAELRLHDLLQADEVFLTGSVRGVEPVRSVDGSWIHRGGGVSERIAAGLRRRWLG
ncbi:MAG TPA: aminotransferase class IV, partial [Solirubrobacterales bacterium]|nr:aminotransferase class IV [Solirubrobacterales bacterium]